MIEALLHAAFDDVGKRNCAQHPTVLGNQQRCSTAVGNVSNTDLQFGWNVVAAPITKPFDRLQSAFADFATVNIHARHSGLRRKRNESCAVRRKIAAAELVALLCQHNNRASFRSFVRQRRKLRGIREIRLLDAGCWKKLRCGAVPERDRSRFVQQQYVNVA